MFCLSLSLSLSLKPTLMVWKHSSFRSCWLFVRRLVLPICSLSLPLFWLHSCSFLFLLLCFTKPMRMRERRAVSFRRKKALLAVFDKLCCVFLSWFAVLPVLFFSFFFPLLVSFSLLFLCIFTSFLVTQILSPLSYKYKH